MSEAATTPVATGGDSTSGGSASATTSTASINAPVAQDWTSGLSDDMKGYVQNKGFKDPTMVLDSYRNFEKLMGVPQDKILKLPAKEDDPAWNDVYGKLGRPSKHTEYNIPIPKENADPAMAEWAKEVFYKSGLSNKQAADVAAAWNARMEQMHEAQQVEMSNQFEQQAMDLKREWGAAYDQNVAMAKRATREFGVDEATIDALESSLGYAGTIKFMQSIGAKLGEDSFVAPTSQSGRFGAMTPAAAQNKLNSLKQDQEWVGRYLSGGVKEKEEMTSLLHMANQE